MKTAVLTTIVAGLSLVLLAPVADAGRPREHDGFFLRLSGGFGTARTEIENLPFQEGGVDWEFSGVSGDGNFAIGGIVSRNLALHGTVGGWSLTNPDLEVGGIDFDTDDVTLSMGYFGGGVTYYFMPSNVYLSGSVGLASLTLDVDGDDADSDTGVAFDFTVGKEWWVGNSWGLGVAAAAGVHSIPAGGGLDEDFTGSNFAIRFSATLN